MRRALMMGAVLLGAAAMAEVGGFAPIQTTYQITGPTLVDPPPDEPKDRVAFYMTGAGARRIYDAMPGKPVGGICGEDMTIKTSGALACSRQGKSDYTCTVAVLLKTGQSKAAFVC